MLRVRFNLDIVVFVCLGMYGFMAGMVGVSIHLRDAYSIAISATGAVAILLILSAKLRIKNGGEM